MAQPYYLLELVKPKLGIDQDNNDSNDTLDKAGKESDNWIDFNLKDLITVPIATVTQDIREISSTRAAGLFQLRNSNDPTKKPYYLTLSEQLIAEYRLRLNEAKENTKTTTMLGKTAGNITTQ